MQSLKVQVQISKVSDVQCSAMSAIQCLKDYHVSEHDSQASETDEDSAGSSVGSVLDDLSSGFSTKPPSQIQATDAAQENSNDDDCGSSFDEQLDSSMQSWEDFEISGVSPKPPNQIEVTDAAREDSDDDGYGSSFNEQLDFSMQSWEGFEISEVSPDTPTSVRGRDQSPVKWRTSCRDSTPARQIRRRTGPPSTLDIRNIVATWARSDTINTTAVSSTSRPRTATMLGTIKTHQLDSSETALSKDNKTTRNRMPKTRELTDDPEEIDRERFLVVMEELRATRRRMENMVRQISQEMSRMENDYSIRYRK